MSFLDKHRDRVRLTPAKGGDAEPTDPPGEFPLLEELMWTVTLSDGSTRETMSVTVFVEDGRLKAALNDRDLGVVAFVTGESLMDLFSTVERSLVEDCLDWRASNSRKRKKGGRSG